MPDRCLVCGAPHAACLGVGSSSSLVSLPTTRKEETVADSDVNRYTLEVNGVQQTFVLTEADAKARGAKPLASAKPSNKSATADSSTK